jgi:hypothetical protein
MKPSRDVFHLAYNKFDFFNFSGMEKLSLSFLLPFFRLGPGILERHYPVEHWFPWL